MADVIQAYTMTGLQILVGEMGRGLVPAAWNAATSGSIRGGSYTRMLQGERCYTGRMSDVGGIFSSDD